MVKKQTYQIWEAIEYPENWLKVDTSILDDIAPSWFRRRRVLEEKSSEYQEFLNQLKREHAIETGIVERLYDLKKGITETFIKQGFVKSYLSHGDTNVPKETLFNHLNDHLDAVDFVFDVVKENRPLTVGFIKELHALTTQHQNHAEGRDQFGNKLKIPLRKGAFKIRENNPTSFEGILIKYCPPDHVDSEMENLVKVYNQLVEEKVNPLIIVSWFHHAFVAIHPFQDGNGRVGRLLASLIFIKFGYFPITVLREERDAKYFDALQKADEGIVQNLVHYFGEIQKRNILRGLNVKEVKSEILAEAEEAFLQKIEQPQSIEISKEQEKNYQIIYNFCQTFLENYKNNLQLKLNGNASISLNFSEFAQKEISDKFDNEIANLTQNFDYYFNANYPKWWFQLNFNIAQSIDYQLVFVIHHLGYDNSVLAIGAFLKTFKNELERKNGGLKEMPHVFSILENVEEKEKNIQKYLEKILTRSLTQISNEI